MSWFSILPEDYAYIETWMIRIFILLGVLSMGPWALLIVYDLVLYLFRATTYDLPYVGGRARNRPRPRAPSLRIPTTTDPTEEKMGLKKRSERTGHERISSKNELVDDE